MLKPFKKIRPCILATLKLFCDCFDSPPITPVFTTARNCHQFVLAQSTQNSIPEYPGTRGTRVPVKGNVWYPGTRVGIPTRVPGLGRFGSEIMPEYYNQYYENEYYNQYYENENTMY
eukprot:124580-Rhodomonas_salina.2